MNLVALRQPSRDSGTFTPARDVDLGDSAPNAAQNGVAIQLPTGMPLVPAGQPPAGGSAIEVAVAGNLVPPAGVGSDHYGGAEAPPQNIRAGVAFSPAHAQMLDPVDRTPYNRPASYFYTSQIVPDVGNQLNAPWTGIHGEIEQGVGAPPGYMQPWRPTQNTFRLEPQTYDAYLPLVGNPPS